MNSEEKNKLNASAMEVFGTMYFTPIELLVETPRLDDAEKECSYIRADISYDGPHRADITFYFPRRLGETIAEGFLGIDAENLDERQVVDTMREAANMIVGNFLGKIDPDGACSLSIPAAEVVTSCRPEGHGADCDVLAFMTDYGYLWMVVA